MELFPCIWVIAVSKGAFSKKIDIVDLQSCNIKSELPQMYVPKSRPNYWSLFNQSAGMYFCTDGMSKPVE